MEVCSISSSICLPVISLSGVLMTVAPSFNERISCNDSAIFSSFATSVWLKTMQLAFSTWLMKNSPKFFMYILHLFASTTVVQELIVAPSMFAPITAFVTSLNLPTPEGSIIILSGEYCFVTFFNASAKSPTSEQQIQPLFISVILMPDSFKNPPSIPISPNSFSIKTTFSPQYASAISFLISVVLPLPKNPEKISIFIFYISYVFIFILLFCRFYAIRMA